MFVCTVAVAVPTRNDRVEKLQQRSHDQQNFSWFLSGHLWNVLGNTVWCFKCFIYLCVVCVCLCVYICSVCAHTIMHVRRSENFHESFVFFQVGPWIRLWSPGVAASAFAQLRHLTSLLCHLSMSPQKVPNCAHTIKGPTTREPTCDSTTLSSRTDSCGQVPFS